MRQSSYKLITQILGFGDIRQPRAGMCALPQLNVASAIERFDGIESGNFAISLKM
jgi:hypothetical protein